MFGLKCHLCASEICFCTLTDLRNVIYGANALVELGGDRCVWGVANYYGDLTQDYVVWDESHPYMGGFIKYNFNHRSGLKLDVIHGTISAADANSDRADQLLRNPTLST